MSDLAPAPVSGPRCAPVTVLTLPGWQGSGPQHWQSRWEVLHAARRVEQHDWWTPRRGDWMARLDEVLVDLSGPVCLAAHSLACVLVAAWAQHTRHAGRVRGALLVAPGDVEQPDLAPLLPGWGPIVRQPLPFRSRLLASRNDPYCTIAKAAELAQAWGSEFIDAGERGHLNADAGLGDWPEGWHLLQSCCGQAG